MRRTPLFPLLGLICLSLGLLSATACRTTPPTPANPTTTATPVASPTPTPLPSPTPTGPGVPGDVAAAIRALVDDGYSASIALAVVDATGVTYDAYGQTAYADGRPVDEHTLYEIGSVTKTFTALLLAKAVEEGRVALDDPVTGPVAVPSLAGQAITFGQLATHTSGLPRWPPDLMPSPDAIPVGEDVTCAQMEASLAAYELSRPPGLTYEYSNWGLGLLSLALESVYDRPFDPLLRAEVLAPLGLDDTVFYPSPEQAARQAAGYQDGETPADPIGVGCISLGAGALKSTTADLARYLAAEMGLESTPLAPAILLTQQPRFRRAPDAWVGLVWELNASQGIDLVEHGGNTLGFNSYVAFAPALSRGVVILANASYPVASVGRRLLDPTLAALPVLPEEGVADPTRFPDYAGRFGDMTGSGFEVIAADGQLFGRFPFWVPMRLFPLAGEQDAYFARALPLTVEFLRDASGAVNALRLGDDGGFQFYARAD